MKQLKLITLIILLLSVSAGTYAQGCNNKLKVGSSWEMTSYDKKDKVTAITVSKVIDIRSDGDETVYVIESQVCDKNGNPQEDGLNKAEIKCQNGSYYIDMQQFAKSLNSELGKEEDLGEVSVEFDMDPAEVPQKNTSVGTILKDAFIETKTTFKSSIIPPIKLFVELENRKVESIEDKETPAGTFKCHKVVSDAVFKSMMLKKEYKNIEWYYDGFISVYSEFYDRKGRLQAHKEMTKFKY